MKPEELKKLPAIRGRDELIKYLRGERITHKQAVLAKCYECKGYCADGKVDCEIADCPLYLFNPFRKQPVPQDRAKRGEGVSLKVLAISL